MNSCSALQQLLLSHNQLSCLPVGMGSLTRLIKLQLDSNR